jgi:hypothetical protein
LEKIGLYQELNQGLKTQRKKERKKNQLYKNIALT